MKKTKRRKKTILIIISVVVCVAVILCIAIIGGVSHGFKDWSSFKPNLNTQNAQVFLNDVECSAIPSRKGLTRIDVKSDEAFSVRIQPKEEALFDFELDGKLHPFSCESGDYNKAFSLAVYDGYFEFDTTWNKMLDILSTAYWGHTISGIDETKLDRRSYFECLVNFENGKILQIDILEIGSYLAVCLDETEIIFL